jgi:hypothetical protein
MGGRRERFRGGLIDEYPVSEVRELLAAPADTNFGNKKVLES